jgi:cell filamentation protein, protein adenylyltransferase
VLANKLGLVSASELRDAENDLLEFRVAELRASPVIVRQTFDMAHLRAMHRHLFQDVYEWAGQLRTVGIAKNGESFVPPLNIAQPLSHVAARIDASDRLLNIAEDEVASEIAYLYDYTNYAHPFREGNGRTQREFFDQLLALSGRGLAWDTIDMTRLHEACHNARVEVDSDIGPLEALFADLLTNDPAY